MRSRTARLIVCLIRDPGKGFSFDAHRARRPSTACRGSLRTTWRSAPSTGWRANETRTTPTMVSSRTCSESCKCTAPVSPQTFAIPGWLLSTLPPSGLGGNASGTLFYPLGLIWIGQYNSQTTFSATGLDRGIITDIFYGAGVGVYFK